MLIIIPIISIVIIILFIINVYVSYHHALKTNKHLYAWPILGNLIELILFNRGSPSRLLKALINGMPTGQLAHCRLIHPIAVANDRCLWQALSENSDMQRRHPINDPTQGSVALGMNENGLLLNTNVVRWQYLRKLFQKSLTANLINLATRDIVSSIDHLLTTKYTTNSNGIIKITDAYEFSYLLVSKVILHLGFGVIADESLQKQLGQATVDFLKAFSYMTKTPVWIQKWVFWFKTKQHLQNAKRLYDYIDKMIKDKIEKGLPDKPTNLLEGLLIATNQMNEKPTISEVRQCLVEMILGGFDTTSNTAALMLYAVAQRESNKELNIQQELQKQIDKLIQAHPDNEWVGYTAQSQWPLIDATIRETLRRYPVLEFTSRGVEEAFDLTVKDDKGKECSYHIPEGRMVFPLTTQSDEAFPRPNHFDPVANFINNDKMARIYSTPFGLGPRICVGRFLAESELRAILVTLLKDYTLQIPSSCPWQSAGEVPRRFNIATQIDAAMPLNLIPR